MDLSIPILGIAVLPILIVELVSDLCHLGGFLRVLRFPPPIKLTATI